ITERGGVNPALAEAPPSMLNIDREGSSGEDDRWWELFDVGREPPPQLAYFVDSVLAPAAEGGEIDVVTLALDALLGDDALYSWSEPIRRSLARSAPRPL